MNSVINMIKCINFYIYMYFLFNSCRKLKKIFVSIKLKCMLELYISMWIVMRYDVNRFVFINL